MFLNAQTNIHLKLKETEQLTASLSLRSLLIYCVAVYNPVFSVNQNLESHDPAD